MGVGGAGAGRRNGSGGEGRSHGEGGDGVSDRRGRRGGARGEGQRERAGGDRATGWEVRAVAAGAGAGCDERGGRCSVKLEPALLKMLIVCKHKFRVFVLCSLAF